MARLPRPMSLRRSGSRTRTWLRALVIGGVTLAASLLAFGIIVVAATE